MTLTQFSPFVPALLVGILLIIIFGVVNYYLIKGLEK